MKTFLFSLLMLIIGATIGYYVDLYKSSEKGRIRYIDQKVDVSSSVFNLPTMPGQKLQIFLNNAEINDVTEVRVSLSNFEDKDFSDVPVYITLTPKDGSNVDVITKDAYVGELKSRDRIENLEVIKKPIKDKAMKFGFNINTINRSYTHRNKVYIVFYLRGKVDPEVKVSINKAGLELRDFSYDHWDNLRPTSETVIPIAIITALILFILGYFYFFWWYTFIYKEKKRLKVRVADTSYLNKRLKDEMTNESIDPNLGGHLLYELEKISYDELSTIDKLFNSEPKLEDFVSSNQNHTNDNNVEQD